MTQILRLFCRSPKTIELYNDFTTDHVTLPAHAQSYKTKSRYRRKETNRVFDTAGAPSAGIPCPYNALLQAEYMISPRCQNEAVRTLSEGAMKKRYVGRSVSRVVCPNERSVR